MKTATAGINARKILRVGSIKSIIMFIYKFHDFVVYRYSSLSSKVVR